MLLAHEMGTNRILHVNRLLPGRLLSIYMIFQENQERYRKCVASFTHDGALTLSLLAATFVIFCMPGSRGGAVGDRAPLKKYKNIGFLSNTGPDLVKITKLQSQYSILGHYRPVSEMPFKSASLAG